MAKFEQLIAVSIATAAIAAGCGGNERLAACDPRLQQDVLKQRLIDGRGFKADILASKVRVGIVEVDDTKDKSTPAIYDPIVISCGQVAIGYAGRLGDDQLEIIPATDALVLDNQGANVFPIVDPYQEGFVETKSLHATPPTKDAVVGFEADHHAYALIP
jgi:hypothetical protein